MGLDEFRETIQAFVAEDDIICSKANILITNGAKHAADLLFRAFIDPGDRIIVSAPTYMTTLQCMRNHDVNFIAIPQDNEGMNRYPRKTFYYDQRKRLASTQIIIRHSRFSQFTELCRWQEEKNF